VQTIPGKGGVSISSAFFFIFFNLHEAAITGEISEIRKSYDLLSIYSTAKNARSAFYLR
jgi:hypothetical protein